MTLDELVKGLGDLFGIASRGQKTLQECLRRAMRDNRLLNDENEALSNENEELLDEVERLRKEIGDLKSDAS
jgi:cell division protein FtsB